MTRLQKLWRCLIAIVFPNRCVCCGTVIPPPDTMCHTCERSLPTIKPPICPYCAHQKSHCRCLKHRHIYDKIAAVFYYEEAAKKGIVRLKRRDDPLAVRQFAEWMCTVIRREFADESIDCLAYVPMTKIDLREREYNQSERLASALSERLHRPVCHALVKLYDVPPQKKKGLRERSGNVLGVFDVADPSVRGQTVLLVDDVLTTGSTLNECAKMLKLYGAKRVLAVTFAVRKYKREKDEVNGVDETI